MRRQAQSFAWFIVPTPHPSTRCCSAYGRSNLHWACWNAHQDVIELLLNHGAVSGVKDGNGALPIDLVIDEEAKKDIAKLIADLEVSPDDDDGGDGSGAGSW